MDTGLARAAQGRLAGVPHPPRAGHPRTPPAEGLWGKFSEASCGNWKLNVNGIRYSVYHFLLSPSSFSTGFFSEQVGLHF